METSHESLSGLQKRCFRAVIILGLLAIALVAIMPWIGKPGVAGAKAATAIGEWIGFLGGFHPIFLHLPIGAVMVVLVMELFGLVTFGRYRARTTVALFFGAAMGVFAVILGYFLYLTGDFSGELIEAHKKAGIVFTILLVSTFLVKYSADVFPAKTFLRPFYLLGLLATVGVMMKAGHLGGEVTHGDPMDNPPWKKEVKVKDEQPAIPDLVVFDSIVMPIFEEKCVSCHGEKKQKSEFRMDTLAAIKAGGEIQADGDGDALVPGNAEESMIVSSLLLPEDDDLHMPPEGKKQLTPEEITVIEWWVASGASETATLGEIMKSVEVEAALETLK